MKTFRVELTKTFRIVAETEDEAVDKVCEISDDYRLSSFDTYSVEEEDK